MKFDNSGDRLKGETPLAYRYYELYRDMVPGERSLQVLCDREVTGKKKIYIWWRTQPNRLCYKRAICVSPIIVKSENNTISK